MTEQQELRSERSFLRRQDPPKFSHYFKFSRFFYGINRITSFSFYETTSARSIYFCNTVALKAKRTQKIKKVSKLWRSSKELLPHFFPFCHQVSSAYGFHKQKPHNFEKNVRTLQVPDSQREASAPRFFQFCQQVASPYGFHKQKQQNFEKNFKTLEGPHSQREAPILLVLSSVSL